MATVRAKISETGRMTIPTRVRAALGLKRGGDVIVEVVDGELRVRTVVQAMQRARAVARTILAGKAGGTVDDILLDRHRDAEPPSRL